MISNALSSAIDAIKRSTPGLRDKADHPISRDALRTIDRGQWVRDRFLDAHPELLTNHDDMGKGPKAWADLNRNGFPDESEIFDDFDGDGVVGNIDDFIHYYEKNHKIIEQNIPFFKWAASMDPRKRDVDDPLRDVYNPLNDYLSLSYEVLPSSDIENAYAVLGGIRKGIRFYAAPGAPLQAIAALLQKELNNVSLPTAFVISEKISSLLFLGVAYQFGVINAYDDKVSMPGEDGSVESVDSSELYANFYFDHARFMGERRNIGDLEGARDHYADALVLDPSRQSTYHRLGRVLHDLDSYEEAIEVYEAALKRDRYDAKALAGRGAAYLALKNIRAAQADLSDAIKCDPTHAPAHVGLGRIQHLKKNLKGARKHYTAAIKADPSSALGFYWRAIAWDDDKRPKKAITDYIRSIKRDRSSGDAFYGLALAQHDVGYYNYAYKNFRAAIRRDPSNAFIYKDLGYLQMDRKKPKSALWAFNKALKLKPKLVSALIGRGSVMHDQANNLNDDDMYLDAEKDYKKALAAVDPKDSKTKARVFRNLGFLYADMNMPKIAYESFRKVVVHDPKNPRAHFELGEILSRSKFRGALVKAVGTNLDLAALRAFKDATDLDKKYMKAHLGRAMAWCRLGKYQVALKILNKCLDIDKHNGDTLYLRSKVHTKLGNYGSAGKDRHDACVRLKSRLCERQP